MTIAIVISIISLIVTTYFAYKNSNRKDNETTEDRVREQATINVKLDTIATDVRDIKYDISETKRQVQEHDKAIALLNNSVKSLHHRLDERKLDERKEE